MSKTVGLFTILLIISTVAVLSKTKSLESASDVLLENNTKTNPVDEAGNEAVNEAVKEINELVDTIKLTISNITREQNTDDDELNGPEAKRTKLIRIKTVYSLLKLLAKMTKAVGRILAAAAVAIVVPHVG